MTLWHKYILTVLIGWIVPLILALLCGNAMAMAAAAVAIAWWHGYLAARLELKLRQEQTLQTVNVSAYHDR